MVTPLFLSIHLPASGQISIPAVCREPKRLAGKEKDGVSGDLRRENAQGVTRLLPKGPPFYHLPCTTLRHFPPGTRAQVSLGSPNQQLDRRHQPTAQQNPKPKGKMAKDLKRHFPKQTCRGQKALGDMCPASLMRRDMHVKGTLQDQPTSL